MKPRIAITLGDPAGIGPEIVAKALKDPRVRRACDPVVIGHPPRVPMGKSSRKAGLFAIQALQEGVAMVREGEAHALVTAPISKETFRLANYGFPGHTEWLAAICGGPDVAMLMVSGPLRAILMTRHVPLREVSKHLTKELIVRSAQLGHAFLQTVTPAGRKPALHTSGGPGRRLCGDPGPSGFEHKKATGSRLPPLPVSGRKQGPSAKRSALGRSCRWTIRRDDGQQEPRLVLCGLNPHAGDHGLIGREEDLVFRPALRSLIKQGLFVEGPLPADSIFPLMAKGRFDLALAAYHDQGMIPLKLYAPDRVVNITLGLPFIRTSPGHGTAYDIAGKGQARPGSMIEAILLAAAYCK